MTNRVQHLTIPAQALRDAAVVGLDAGEDYGHWVTQFPVLQEIQMGSGDSNRPIVDQFRIGAWNLERGAQWSKAVDCIRDAQLDVVLASELDFGMSRSQQLHTTQHMAQALGWHWAFAVEFIELGLGSPWEQNRPSDEAENLAGLHGNAILSRFPLDDLRLIRFQNSDGYWWHRRWNEPRLGGRIALVATLQSAYGPVQIVSTHLESNANPRHRASQVSDILEQLEPNTATVLGGDLNTNTIDIDQSSDLFRLRSALVQADATRFLQPEPHEPVFALLASAGFRKGTANTADTTQRPRERGYPKPPFGRIDWLFVRGCLATNPATLAALDPTGQTISDHELITANIVLR